MNKFRMLGLFIVLVVGLPSVTTAQAFVKDAKAEKEIKAVFDITAEGWNWNAGASRDIS